MYDISKSELIDAITMYLDSKEGVDNIYSGCVIKSTDELIDIYCESARDTRKSDITRLWKHMIKWDCQRHKQTRSWFDSMVNSRNDILSKTKMTYSTGNDRKYYESNKNSIYINAVNEAYNECKTTGYMTGAVPMILPEEYELDYICSNNNLIEWIRKRAENDEVFNIKELSDLSPVIKKSTPDIPVKKAFNKK